MGARRLPLAVVFIFGFCLTMDRGRVAFPPDIQQTILGDQTELAENILKQPNASFEDPRADGLSVQQVPPGSPDSRTIINCSF